jgi:hypothetical protein
MIFKKKRFFLDLSGGKEADKPVQVAPVKEVPTGDETPKTQASVAASAAAAAVAPPAADVTVVQTAAGEGRVLTTAEAIAAELAAAQANRPAPTSATFAPECLSPSGALPRRRRRGGANLAPFMTMAKGMGGS